MKPKKRRSSNINNGESDDRRISDEKHARGYEKRAHNLWANGV